MVTGSWSSSSTCSCARPSAARASTPSATPPSSAASPRVSSATTTSAASPAPSPRCPTRPRSSASWSPASPGSVRSSRFLDDPAVEEVWINDPSRVFVARHGRHELTNLILTRAQVDELVERMLKSSGRRIDLSRPFVDAMLPEGHRLHVVLEGISRGFTAVNIRKFVLKAARLSDLVELGSLTAGGRGVPRGVGARRAERPGRRRNPGRQDHAPQLPRRGHPGRRPGGVGRGGVRAPVPAPRLGADADPAVRAGRYGRDRAARPRPREPADATEPDHRGRGPLRGVPGPAARPQRRACRACAPCTPTARGRRW